MMLQSANGYVLIATSPEYAVLRAPIFGELLLEWRDKAEWHASRPPDAPRLEVEARRDVDALKGYRHTVIVVGRHTLTYWPWDVVRKWRIRNRRPAPEHQG